MLNVSCEGGGSVLVNGSVPQDGSMPIDRHEQVVIEAVPLAGYSVDAFTVSSDYGVSLQSNSLTVTRMVQDLTVKIIFKQDVPFIPADADGVIREEAFAGMEIVQAVCPDGVTAIGSRAFADCTQLTRVVIPASVNLIAHDAFEGCTGLTIAGVPGSYAEIYAQTIGAVFEPLPE